MWYQQCVHKWVVKVCSEYWLTLLSFEVASWASLLRSEYKNVEYLSIKFLSIEYCTVYQLIATASLRAEHRGTCMQTGRTCWQRYFSVLCVKRFNGQANKEENVKKINGGVHGFEYTQVLEYLSILKNGVWVSTHCQCAWVTREYTIDAFLEAECHVRQFCLRSSNRYDAYDYCYIECNGVLEYMSILKCLSMCLSIWVYSCVWVLSNWVTE
jgi:hypothetical protein